MLIILAVVLLIIATSVWNSWRPAYTEQAEDQVAVLRELSSAAVSAANDADRAIYGKLNADKVLLDKIRAEQSAESKATHDAATALRLKSENSGAAKKAEETAKASRDAANEAKKERIKAETDAARALAAVVAAKKSLQSSEAEIALAFRSPHGAAFIVLSLLLVSIFPLSAIAFMWLEVPSLLTQLDVDSRMLGSQRHAFTSTGSGDSNLIGHRWNGFSYSLHCGLAVFATAVGAALFFRTEDELLDVNTLRGMQLGFLGAYVYCLNLVYRRYTTRDLALYCSGDCRMG